ncbi:MAG: S-layer homology domain-containing protein [Clostridia bacterium]|nr:S-layer homology domain-containing protein [Clostridia bacterium]
MKMKLGMMMCFILLFNSIFISYDSAAKKIDITENDVISYVLGENCLDVLPDGKHDNDTLTRGEMIEILIKYTNVNDDYKGALLYSLGLYERYHPFLEYGDYHSDTQKEEGVRRLNHIGILPNVFLIYPEKLCTWEDAITMIVSVFDRYNLSESYGGTIEYAKFRNILRSDVALGEPIDFKGVKELLFYALFTVVMQRDYLKHGDVYYEFLSDCLYLCHDYYYKIGYPIKSYNGIKINDIMYFGEADVDFEEYVICLYKIENGRKMIKQCLNISELMYENILAVNSVYNVSNTRTETEVHDLFSPVEVGEFIESTKPIDKEFELKSRGIDLWQSSTGDTITRAQVVKTALQLSGRNFLENHPLYQGNLPFYDITKEDASYIYISAAYNSGAIEGYGDGFFYPEKACTWGEAIKILCCLTGHSIQAEKLALEKSDNVFPKYYEEVMYSFNLSEFDIPYDEIRIKDSFVELVWNFMWIP